ncbi:MAG: LacI family transcriptional regulator [Peptococcaceae bacterium]|jgi:LacI family transcriptional regulator|nr:LacI family transcriptional regulator [Peptococcaceae bacterium]
MKVSIRDVAKKSNVSITTVSRYLNNNYDSMSESTRQHIEKIIRQSGYVYRPKKKCLNRVGLVLPDIANPFFAQMVSALETSASRRGYEILLGITGEDFEKEAALVKRLSESDAAGIIYMSAVSTTQNCYDYLKENNVSFVALDSYLDNYTMPAAVYVDGKKGMYELTLALIEKGHRDFAYISGLKYSSFGHSRYQGHINALLESGITVNPELVRFSGFEPGNGAESFLSLRQSGAHFTAVICENDMIAFGVADECRKLGLRIPDDLSLTGFDDTNLARYYNPPLTSVNQHLDQQGEKALELLIGQINGETPEEKYVVIPPTLALRESVKELK